MNNLEICCSPNTYKRVKNDKQYMMEVAKDVVAEQESSYNQVTFSQQIPAEIAEAQNVNHETLDDMFVPICDISVAEQSDDKKNWHDASIKLLLSLIEELQPKLGKSFSVKTKGKMYKIIAERMANQGYNYTPIQIENKFRGLERNYKKTVLHNKKTVRNRQTCSYESELNRIFGEKKGINPEYLLDSQEERSKRKLELLEKIANRK